MARDDGRRPQPARSARGRRRGLEREPDNAFAHLTLDRTLERADRSTEARRHVRLAAALDPNPDHLAAARFDDRPG